MQNLSFRRLIIIKVLMVLMGMEIGGAETHVLELAIGMKKRGIDVLVASNGGVYVKELEENGIKHFSVPLNKRSLSKMLVSFFKLWKIIKKEKPDIVHGHARIPSFILSKLRPILKFNFVTTAHWVFDTSGILKYITNWGDRTVAVSDDIKDYLTDNYGVPAQNIRVTINGIDKSKFSKDNFSQEIIEEFGLSKDKRKILYISRMDKERSLVAHHLIEIADDIAKIEDVEIIIVGGGDDFDNVSRFAEEQNQKIGRKMIHIAGARTDIYKFVSVSDFFVGVSRSALEAMSGGVPSIIAGNEGYIGIFDEDKLTECIDTNFCCRGMAQSSPARLLKDISDFLNADHERLEHLSEYSAEFVHKNYSVDKMVSDNLASYEDILSGGRYSDVVVSGYYGYNNSGDDALLHLIINDILKLRPNTKFTVLSKTPYQTTKTYKIKSVNRFNIFKVIHEIRHSKLLISGGGSLIQDATSTKSLLYYLAIIRIALMSGKKTMAYANGIGPVTVKQNKKKARKVLDKMDVITLRDEKSVLTLKNIGVNNKNIFVTADPAVKMERISQAETDSILEAEGIPKNNYFTVSVRNWKNTDVSEKIAAVCDYVSEHYGLTPLFISMQKGEDDVITEKCVSLLKNRGYILRGSYNFRQIMSIVAESKLVIGMRLHMLMYGANSAVPVIGLMYDPKIQAYLSYLNQNTNVNINNINVDEFKNIIDSLMLNQEKTRETLKVRIDELKEFEKKNAQMAVKLLEDN